MQSFEEVVIQSRDMATCLLTLGKYREVAYLGGSHGSDKKTKVGEEELNKTEAETGGRERQMIGDGGKRGGVG